MSTINFETYRQARASAVEEGLAGLHRGIASDPERRQRFDRTSGVMLEHFLGSTIWRQHQNPIDRITATQVGSAFDQDFFIHDQRFDLLDQWVDIEYPPGEDASLFDESSVFCAFHLNSYRLFWYLLRRRIQRPLFYILADHVIRDQNPEAARRLGRLQDAESVRIVPAESPLVMRMACEALNKGDSVLAYVDGNTGVGGKRRFDSRLLSIPFLNGKIRVRQGLPHMAYLSRRPLRPVQMLPGPDDGLTLRVHEAILPGRGEDRAQFAQRAMRCLYGLLETQVQDKPWAWTEWSTLHIATIADEVSAPEATQQAPPASGQPVAFNHARFELLPYPFGDVLLDRHTLRFYPVEAAHQDQVRALYAETSTPRAEPCTSLADGLASLWRIGAICPSLAPRAFVQN